MQFTPVKECALAHNIPVYQPKKIREPECIEELKKYQADVCVVVAFDMEDASKKEYFPLVATWHLDRSFQKRFWK